MNYKIGGCDVSFPHKAYGTQLSFMGKVISALQAGHNALLEAPTGSGKTLSLLCSSLAWQQNEKKHIEEARYIAAQAAAQGAPVAAAGGEGKARVGHPPAAEDSITPTPHASVDTPAQPNQKTQNKAKSSSPDSEFQICLDAGTTAASKASPDATIAPLSGAGLARQEHGHHASPQQPVAIENEGGFVPLSGNVEPAAPPRATSPRIYYATRTHSQIAQVVRELKRSTYAPRMAILASKQHYCVNKHARSQPNLEEACEDLLKQRQCKYANGVQFLANSASAWELHDVEDLCKLGTSTASCPFFVSRHWENQADIVFCPYNYLVDPVIRRALEINIEHAVVIFDEGHNMEDVCREAATLSVDRGTIMEAQYALERASESNGPDALAHYKLLKSLLDSIDGWMKAREGEAASALARSRPGGRGSTRFQPYERLWLGPGMMVELRALKLEAEDVDELWEAYQMARAKDEEIRDSQTGSQGNNNNTPANGGAVDGSGSAPTRASSRPVPVGSRSLGTLSRIIQIAKMLHQVSDDGARDYRLAFQRIHHSTFGGGNNAPRISIADGPTPPEHIVTLGLWCLNPSVAFRQVSSFAHSVILTSGTLAPTDSFASELGTAFPVRLEAPHVVNLQRQVWAGVMAAGPSGFQLQATYQNTDKPEFQDAMGATILSVCGLIPDGVLLFLPSYSLMDRLVARWKVTGVWSRLSQAKHLVMEPRGGGSNEALKTVMQEYYEAIASGKGGLFMAVCRGKVSEGLDFADKNARGVIIVGIPFPNVKDTKVDAKRRFNDNGVKTLGLLNGNIWYEQQAFRALNQAIGRCIRHRNDWGAIILVDDRFMQPRYQRGLSRWVRGALTAHPNYDVAASSMRAFFTRLQAEPPGPPTLPLLVENQQQQRQEGAPAVEEPKLDAISLLMAGARAHTSSKNAAQVPMQVGSHFATAAASANALAPDSYGTAPPARPPCPETFAALVRLIRSFAPIVQWSYLDVNNWSAFIQKNTNPGTTGMSAAAAWQCGLAGIQDVFWGVRADLLHGIAGTENINKTMRQGLQPPRGVQAVLAAAGHQFAPRFALDQDAIAFGVKHLRGWDTLAALDAMEAEYAAQMKALRFDPGQSNTAPPHFGGVDGEAAMDVQPAQQLPISGDQSRPLRDSVEAAVPQTGLFSTTGSKRVFVDADGCGDGGPPAQQPRGGKVQHTNVKGTTPAGQQDASNPEIAARLAKVRREVIEQAMMDAA